MKMKFICPKCGTKDVQKFSSFKQSDLMTANAYMSGSKKRKCPNCNTVKEID